jgi:hypothetical protein
VPDGGRVSGGPAIPTGRAGQTDTRTADGCPTEGGRAPVGGGQVPDGGRMGARWRARWVPDGGRISGGGPTAGLGGGPTEEYIRAGGPHFWALSSSAQSHLQEMRVRRVLMSESVL